MYSFGIGQSFAQALVLRDGGMGADHQSIFATKLCNTTKASMAVNNTALAWIGGFNCIGRHWPFSGLLAHGDYAERAMAGRFDKKSESGSPCKNARNPACHGLSGKGKKTIAASKARPSAH